MKRYHKTTGQALVEFALMATLLFFLLAAAIDIGLAFFAVQGLRNAAQEGAQYGSDNLTVDADGKFIINTEEIRRRVRYEGGDESARRSGFVNLLDLNADGTTDDPTVYDTYIDVTAVTDEDGDGDPFFNHVADPPTAEKPCDDPAGQRGQRNGCFLIVTVRSDHKSFFPLAPIFGSKFTLSATQYTKIRASAVQSGPQ